MKAFIPKILPAVLWAAMTGLASAEIPLNLPQSDVGQELPYITMPRLSPLPPSPIQSTLIDQTLSLRTLPGLDAVSGRRAVMQRIADDPIKRAHAVGHLAEDDIVHRNPAYRKTASPNAPQNDIWTFFQGKLQGGQIKTHRSGDAAAYIRDMFVDDKAEHFLVPDDHFPSVEFKLKQQVVRAEAMADWPLAGELQRHLGRLRKLGRTYVELDNALFERATSFIVRSNATRSFAGGTLATFAIDGAVVIYRSASGTLTPDQTVQELVEGGWKATATGTMVGAAVLLGANPVGFTVIVVGVVTYVVVDCVIQNVRSTYASAPMNKAEIEAILPPGWHLRDY